MAYAALAIGGSALAGLAGGVMGSNAARDAANQQADAIRHAADVQQQMYNQTREDQQPWRQAGQEALGQMQDPNFQKSFTMADFQQDPGYAFRMQEGQKALERSAAAKGGLMNGGFAKALTQYGQDMGSQEYQNAYNRFNNDQTTRFNRLGSLAGVGQQATNTMDQAAMSNGQTMGNLYSQLGNSQAAGTIGQTNAITGGLNQGMNSWMQYSMMNRMFPAKTGG